MSKHTPGPWLLLGTKKVTFPMRSTDCSKGTWRYEPACGDGSFHYSEDAEAEMEANAHLIAAAPELLSVAKLALLITEINLHDPMQLILLNVQLGNLAALAKIVIAKAEGFEQSRGEL